MYSLVTGPTLSPHSLIAGATTDWLNTQVVMRQAKKGITLRQASKIHYSIAIIAKVELDPTC